MSKKALRYATEAAEAIPVNKAYGATVDKTALINAALPIAEARVRLEKLSKCTEKNLKRSNAILRELLKASDRAIGFDMELLHATENYVNQNTMQTVVHEMTSPNGNGAHLWIPSRRLKAKRK